MVAEVGFQNRPGVQRQAADGDFWRPYLKRIISPCSVTRRPPFSFLAVVTAAPHEQVRRRDQWTAATVEQRQLNTRFFAGFD